MENLEFIKELSTICGKSEKFISLLVKICKDNKVIDIKNKIEKFK